MFMYTNAAAIVTSITIFYTVDCRVFQMYRSFSSCIKRLSNSLSNRACAKEITLSDNHTLSMVVQISCSS